MRVCNQHQHQQRRRRRRRRRRRHQLQQHWHGTSHMTAPTVSRSVSLCYHCSSIAFPLLHCHSDAAFRRQTLSATGDSKKYYLLLLDPSVCLCNIAGRQAGDGDTLWVSLLVSVNDCQWTRQWEPAHTQSKSVLSSTHSLASASHPRRRCQHHTHTLTTADHQFRRGHHISVAYF